MDQTPSSPSTWGLGVYYYIVIYALIGTGQALSSSVGTAFLVWAGVRAARRFHSAMLWRVLRAPVSFFDTTPMGRILNRFGKDTYAIDESISHIISGAISTLLTVAAVLTVTGWVTPPFLLFLLPLAFLYRFIQRLYLQSSRELARLESTSKSPIYALFSETLSGLSTLRSFNRQKDLQDRCHQLTDKNTRALYSVIVSNRWLATRLEFIGASLVFASAFFAVVSRSTISPGLAGLSLSYALQLTSSMNWLVRMSTQVENSLISVERVVQYTVIPQEAPAKTDHIPPPDWPQQGAISIEHLELRYRPGLPLVLRGLSAQIRAGEKVGVVGRTGAGKSSLMLALFRLVEPAQGRVLIDGIDLASVGLDHLRSKLAIIPQDPTLFTGTLRDNLDPFEEHPDAAVWAALDAVALKGKVGQMEGQLKAKVEPGGENLSVGTRQLLCLARALLRRSRVLVLDEATASVDFETDSLLQATIRREFKHCTVLTIAHRIATILDADRVMVLDHGKLIEFDAPQVLLAQGSSAFAALAKEGGIIGTASPASPQQQTLLFTPIQLALCFSMERPLRIELDTSHPHDIRWAAGKRQTQLMTMSTLTFHKAWLAPELEKAELYDKWMKLLEAKRDEDTSLSTNEDRRPVGLGVGSF